jgi:hypothetical protein
MKTETSKLVETANSVKPVVSGSFISDADKARKKAIDFYHTVCQPDENFDKFYEKGWIEAINWVIRNYR